MRHFAALVLFIAASTAAAEPGEHRRVDLGISVFTSTPERFTGCVGLHFARQWEVDTCFSGDTHLFTFAPHAFYRWQWAFPHKETERRGLVLSIGPGLGGRVTRFCAFDSCFVSGGPEALVSFEAVEWLREGLGLGVQFDAGLATVWMKDTTGVVDRAYRFPVRILLGVSL